MIIWFAANIPQDSNGGVARSMAELSKGMRTLGFRTKIIYGLKGTVRGTYLWYAFSLCIRLLLHAFDPPAWIVARSTDGVLCAIAVKIIGIKTKIALHNHGWEEIVYGIEKKLMRSLVNAPTTWKARVMRFPLLRLGLYLCDTCINGTLFETRWLAQKYPSCQKKMAYLPNGVSVQPEGFWEKQTEISNSFLAVGGFTWKKNLDYTIEIFKKLSENIPNANLVLVGTGSPTARANRDNKKITVIESEDLENMPQWYKRCAYLIASSRYEGGHSLAILEAMSFGCVAFVSDIPSNREIIIDKRNGAILLGKSVEENATMILDVLGNPRLAASIRHNAFLTAKRNSWSRQTARLKAIVCKH